ncbi:hypothetical protein CAPTEDRAFT_205248 [Capitella teleta]|uniref:Uncharacterized protein n=1 Tax=Capitella teleta TaxID=283909 RepID=R7VDZ9_CAPTE|nr:hypothetical protein CAPTEDRAFT_205248 [Capitella teleta]|eukprot:ELU16782.1 hypothetical protein CAPTEDRAFT_205248 [Capitella teleta]
MDAGWPRRNPEGLNAYWSRRDHLLTDDNVLFINDRVVVPESMQSEMLKLLHEAHIGAEKMTSKVPVAPSHLSPRVVDPRDDLVQQQRMQKAVHDRNAAPLEAFGPGDAVLYTVVILVSTFGYTGCERSTVIESFEAFSETYNLIKQKVEVSSCSHCCQTRQRQLPTNMLIGQVVHIIGDRLKPWYKDEIHGAGKQHRRLERKYLKTKLEVHKEMLKNQTIHILSLIRSYE